MKEQHYDSLSLTLAKLDNLRGGACSLAPAQGDSPRLCHKWDDREVDALQVALVTRRPLLLRGEPGSGKTQLARAAAHELSWALHGMTVYPRMEPNEVLYRFDAVERLAWAQSREYLEEIHSNRFYEPGPLWWALDWESARQAERARNMTANRNGYSDDEIEADPLRLKNSHAKNSRPEGHVVLIDEIDKADADLPNSLLEIFGERTLRLPCAPHRLSFHAPDALPPLILITTNEDRELPGPFLRRCVVLQVEVDADNAGWLMQHRGMAHYRLEGEPDDGRGCLDQDLMYAAAQLLVNERELFRSHGLALPGVAEYLDLLRALHVLQQQLQWSKDELNTKLKHFASYLYRKHGGEHVPADAQQCRVRND